MQHQSVTSIKPVRHTFEGWCHELWEKSAGLIAIFQPAATLSELQLSIPYSIAVLQRKHFETILVILCPDDY
jgi:hypothetical protein